MPAGDVTADLHWLPDDFAERLRSLAGDGFAPAPARDAATVGVLRDTDDGVEVFMLRRVSTMDFAAGMWVFPGGSVDPRDADIAIDWTDQVGLVWRERLDADDALLRGLVGAAVRETFEEAGILLASASPDAIVSLSEEAATWRAERAGLIDRTFAMADVLERHGLRVRADLLRPWMHWMTPETEPKRFDTRFFVAALPVGQQPVHHAGESDHSGWLRPADAVAARQRGDYAMLPPTVAMLTALAEYETVGAVLDAAENRAIHRVLPRLVVSGATVRFLLPGEPDYPDVAVAVRD